MGSDNVINFAERAGVGFRDRAYQRLTRQARSHKHFSSRRLDPLCRLVPVATDWFGESSQEAVKARLWVAEALFDFGETARATDIVARVMGAPSDAVMVGNMLWSSSVAEDLVDSGKLALAQRVLELEIASKHAEESWYILADLGRSLVNLLALRGDFATAGAVCSPEGDHAFLWRAGDSTLDFARGNLCERQGNHSDALRHFTRAHRQDWAVHGPESRHLAGAVSCVARAMFHLGQTREATALLLREVSNNARHATEAWERCGCLRVGVDELVSWESFADALRLLEQGWDMFGRDAELHRDLSRVSLLAGDAGRALLEAEAALARDRESAEDTDMAVVTDLEHVADALATLRDNDRARARLEKAASICVAAVGEDSERAAALRDRSQSLC